MSGQTARPGGSSSQSAPTASAAPTDGRYSSRSANTTPVGTRRLLPIAAVIANHATPNRRAGATFRNRQAPAPTTRTTARAARCQTPIVVSGRNWAGA